MITLTLLTLCLAISVAFADSPPALGLIIMCAALGCATILSLLCSRWFSTILLVIIVGAIIVIFSYFIAVSPNQKLTLKKPLWLVLLLLPAAHLCLYYIGGHYTLTPQEALHTSPRPITWLLGPHNRDPTLVIIAVILFLALIIVAKIARAKDGPLRPFKAPKQ